MSDRNSRFPRIRFNHPMWIWCFRYRSVLMFFSFLCSATIGMYSLYQHDHFKLNNPFLQTAAPSMLSLILSCAHIIIILVLLCRLTQRREIPASYSWSQGGDLSYDRLELAQISVGQFQWWWTVALIGWLFLYVVHATRDVVGIDNKPNPASGASASPASALDAILAANIALSKDPAVPGLSRELHELRNHLEALRTSEVTGLKNEIRSFQQNVIKSLAFLFGSINSAALFAMWAVLSRITVIKDGRNNLKWWWLYAVSAAFIGTLVYFFLLQAQLFESDAWPKSLGKFGEMAGAVILAGLIGKLDSPMISAPRFVIMALYFYAILAASYDPDYINTPLGMLQVFLALPLKVIMYCFIEWTIGSGVLLFYVRRERQEIEEGMNSQAEFVNRLPFTPDQLLRELISRRRLVTCRTAYLQLTGPVCPTAPNEVWNALGDAISQSGNLHWLGRVISLAHLIVDPDTGNPNSELLRQQGWSEKAWQQLFGEWEVWCPVGGEEDAAHPTPKPIRTS